jgi:hypothetical protein
MKIIAFIEDEEVIEKILKHLGLWNLKIRPPPKVKAPSTAISIDDSDSQGLFSTPTFHPDPEYSVDSYRISTRRPGTLMISISAIYLLFPGTPKNYEMVFIYSTEILILMTNRYRIITTHSNPQKVHFAVVSSQLSYYA